ncbi:S4 domain-containing protein, partial [Clostridium sporogenes]
DEVRRLSSLKGAEINEAKKVLAFEVTKLIHGEEEAEKAKVAAEALFGGNAKDLGNMPTAYIGKDYLNNPLVDVLVKCEILPSKSEARRLIKQGGLYVNDEKVTEINLVVTEEHVTEDGIMIRRGKKNFNRIVVE